MSKITREQFVHIFEAAEKAAKEVGVRFRDLSNGVPTNEECYYFILEKSDE